MSGVMDADGKALWSIKLYIVKRDTDSTMFTLFEPNECLASKSDSTLTVNASESDNVCTGSGVGHVFDPEPDLGEFTATMVVAAAPQMSFTVPA
jgi:hypothetical protein